VARRAIQPYPYTIFLPFSREHRSGDCELPAQRCDTPCGLATAVALGARPFADAGCLTLGPSGRGLAADRGAPARAKSEHRQSRRAPKLTRLAFRGGGRANRGPARSETLRPNTVGDYVRRAARPTSSKRVIYPRLRNVRAHDRRLLVLNGARSTWLR
jgi:hypothetical protein